MKKVIPRLMTRTSQLTASETEEDEPPKKRSKATPTKGTKKTPPKKVRPKGRSSKGKDEKSGSEEPWETFIPKEPTPDAGDVEYHDTMIHPNTMKFLKGIGHREILN